jgi:uncharacterized protein (DUF1810 family)
MPLLVRQNAMSSSDQHKLQRFLAAQDEDYTVALSELHRGRKMSHWIWYVFPQVSGLGRSSMAEEYAIRSREEGFAYLAHTVLGVRLHECASALLEHRDKRIEDIMGFPDDLKLRSSMTLFASLAAPDSVFHQVLLTFYAGEMDPMTLAFLNTKS